jgi:hypothetical protein
MKKRHVILHISDMHFSASCDDQAQATRQAPQKLKILREHAMIESAVSSNRIEGITTVGVGLVPTRFYARLDKQGHPREVPLPKAQNGHPREVPLPMSQRWVHMQVRPCIMRQTDHHP